MSGSETIAVAVVGLGKIAQLKYMPALRRQANVRITGIVDAAPTLLEAVGDRWCVDSRARWISVDQMRPGSADLVLVLTHDHYSAAWSAVDHRAAIFVEKPLCWTSREANDLVAHAAARGSMCMAAHMRRFDPHVEAMRKRVDELGRPLFVRASNLAGAAKPWTGPNDGVVRPSAEEKSHAARTLAQAWQRIADASNPARLCYAQTLLQLGIHDLNLIDYVFGPVTDVTAVIGGTHASVTATLIVGDDVPCTLHVVPLFDAPWMWRQSLEAVYPDQVLRIEFGNPFLAVNLTRVVQIGPAPGHREVASIGGEDPFARQVVHLLERVRSGVADDSAEVAVRDLTLIEELIRSLGRP